MITCPNCGGGNDDANLHCVFCGARLVNQATFQNQQIPQAAFIQSVPAKKKSRLLLYLGAGSLLLCLCFFASVMLVPSGKQNDEIAGAAIKQETPTNAPRANIPKTGPKETLVLAEATVEPATAAVVPTATQVMPTATNTAIPMPAVNIPAQAMFTDWLFNEGQLVGIRELVWNKDLGMFAPEKGRIYLSIYIIAINTGSGEKSFNPLDFEIADGGGEVSGEVLFGNKEPGFNVCKIGSGGVCEGWWTTMVWDRPEVRQNLRFRWNPSWLSSGIETPIFSEAQVTSRIAAPWSISSVNGNANGLTCEQILQNKDLVSEVQFSEYLKSLAGQQFSGWKAEVEDVKEGGLFSTYYIVNLRITNYCSVSWTLEDKDQALRYKKGQTMIVSGRIESVDNKILSGSVKISVKGDNLEIQR